MRTNETIKPTIKHVAQRAGVSPTTVSYVLNNTRFVNPETAARVRAAITELDYHPDLIARSLRARRTLTVGMVVSDITNPFYADAVRGAEDVFSHNDYSLILCNTDESPVNELRSLELLRSKKVDGLLIVTSGENPEQLYETDRAGLPIVLVDRRMPGDRLDTVIVDDEQGAHQAVCHLLEHGHRCIGMIAPRLGLSTSSNRIHGYTRALNDFGLAFDPHLLVDGESTIEGGVAAAEKLLNLQPGIPAIFASNNLMAIGLYLVMKQRGLNCPKDLAVVGFDDMAWFSVFNPSLTTIYQPSYELGRRAGELLCQRISGERANGPSLIELSSRLVVRESCGCGLNQASLF